MPKPKYDVGDVLVTIENNGRSTETCFYRVVSLTKTGTPRIYELEKTRQEQSTEGFDSSYQVKPNFQKEYKNEMTETMRWLSTINCFKPSSNSYAYRSGTSFSCELYEEKQKYFDQTLYG